MQFANVLLLVAKSIAVQRSLVFARLIPLAKAALVVVPVGLRIVRTVVLHMTPAQAHG